MRAQDDSRLAAGGLSLEDPSLLRQQCYVNGAWLDAPGRATLPVHNPATGAPLGTVPALRRRRDGESRRRRARGLPGLGREDREGTLRAPEALVRPGAASMPRTSRSS